MFLKRILLTATLSTLLGMSALAQAVSIRLSGATVKDAMEELKKSSGYSFVYKVGDIDTSRKVNIDASDVKQAISQILSGQNVSYSINGKNIVISKSASLAEAPVAPAAAEGGTVTGTVSDENGEPLIGATVALSGTGRATTTDIDSHRPSGPECRHQLCRLCASESENRQRGDSRGGPGRAVIDA